MSQDTLELLLKRRSSKAAMLAEPGPAPQQLETILTAASRVPGKISTTARGTTHAWPANSPLPRTSL